jgi:hypothetical protein
MATPEPVGNELWKVLTAYVDWPAGDEDRLPELGRAYLDAGTTFLSAGGSTTAPAEGTWDDGAGEMYAAKVAELQFKVLPIGEAFKRLGRLAEAYGEDVGYAKAEIARFVADWEPVYRQDPAGVEAAASAHIMFFMNAMAARIANRGITGPDDPDLPRPDLLSPAEAGEAASNLTPEGPGSQRPQGEPKKFPKHLIPPGKKASDVGGPLWGRGPDGAWAAVGKNSPEELRKLLSKEAAQELYDFYQDARKFRPNNPTIEPRLILLKEVLDAWG